MMNNKFIVITPFKNEEKYIEATIQSMLNQSVKPISWILIDDSSTDTSLDIINSYVKNIPWIKVEKNDSSIESKGARIANMVNNFSSNTKIDYLCKIDADVSFEENFFEKIFNAMDNNDRLGICSGTLIYDNKIERPIFSDLTRGATKIYNYNCFKDIGGLLESRGWDTIDNVSAQYKGWETRVLPIYFEHHKLEGISYRWYNRYYESGIYFGSIPYPFYYLVLRCIYRIFNHPPLISQIVVIYGFIYSRFILKKNLLSPSLQAFFYQRIRERLIGKIKNVWHISSN